MENKYQKLVIKIAELILEEAGKPINEDGFIVKLRAKLRKEIGHKDNRLTNKAMFKRDTFKPICTTKDWNKLIVRVNKNKYTLRSLRPKLNEIEEDKDWDWNNVVVDDARFHLYNLLRKINYYKFEELIALLIAKEFKEFKAESTIKSGDRGIDVKAYAQGTTDKSKQRAIFAQAKMKTKNKVGRPEAQNFSGALNRFRKSGNFESITALFVTTSTYTKEFKEEYEEYNENGMIYLSWDINDLVDIMIKNGIGVSYSIDLDFWCEIENV